MSENSFYHDVSRDVRMHVVFNAVFKSSPDSFLREVDRIYWDAHRIACDTNQRLQTRDLASMVQTLAVLLRASVECQAEHVRE